MKIAIDLGHGCPPDGGAVGIVNEETEVRKIAPHLADELRRLGHEVKIIDIKTCRSVTDSLQQRCDQANDWGAGLFVSLHLNAFQATDKPMGSEVYGLSTKAVEVAERVEDALVGLGFKSRGVKDKGYYVLANTSMPAILVESYFLDSKADCAIAEKVGAEGIGKAIACAIHGKAVPVSKVESILSPPPRKLLVKDIIGKCDTGLARGLSLQVIAKINRMLPKPSLVPLNHELLDVSSPAVNPYLQPQALEALIIAAKERGRTMKINSCYRTAVQQHILKQQLADGCCGLTAVAPPGRSNHECGLAIDIEDAQGWRPYLERYGWSWIGQFDPMHFDYWNGRTELGRVGVAACQLLHNEHNKEQIAVDRSYGPTTARAINNMPVDGW
jgi:hypothetical protein